jgi:hypothetical protein
MARIEVRREWTASRIDHGLEAALASTAERFGMALRSEGDEWRMRGGSQLKLRLIGGFLGGPALIPREATLRRMPREAAGTPERLSLVIEDRMGVGFVTGLRGKYEAYFGEIADGIEATLRESSEGLWAVG